MIYPSRLYPAYKPFGVPWLCREHCEVRKPRNIWAEATERYKPDWSLLFDPYRRRTATSDVCRDQVRSPLVAVSPAAPLKVNSGVTTAAVAGPAIPQPDFGEALGLRFVLAPETP